MRGHAYFVTFLFLCINYTKCFIMTFIHVYNTFQSHFSPVTHSCPLLSYWYLRLLLCPALMSFGSFMNLVVCRSVGEGLYTRGPEAASLEKNISLFLSGCNSSSRKGWDLPHHPPLPTAIRISMLLARSCAVNHRGWLHECSGRHAQKSAFHIHRHPLCGLADWVLNPEPGPCLAFPDLPFYCRLS